MTTLLQDLRYAARQLRRSPGFTLIAVLTLALGIGATTVIYSAVNRVLLHPLPFEGGDRMVYVWQGSDKVSFNVWPSMPMIEAWQRNARSFEAIEAYQEGDFFRDGNDGKRRVSRLAVSPTLLGFLGLAPALGRSFGADETKGAGEPVVMLGYGYWQREFGGRNDALGSTLELEDPGGDRVYTIIGVLPRKAALFRDADVWVPLSETTLDGTPQTGANVIGRLRPGITMAAAQAELTDIAGRLPPDPTMPGSADWEARVLSPSDFVSGGLRTALPILLGAVGFVLLIACANVALLLLARGAARERELAIRLSLGAGRRKLVRQLLVESTLLAICGGALGLIFTRWGVDALGALRPASLSDLEHVGVDGRVLAFAVGVAALAAILVGVVPALRATDVTAAVTLRGGGRGGSGAGSSRLRSVLVAGEMMLSVVLLVGAGLLVRSLIELQRADLGFDPHGLVAVHTNMPTAGYSTAASRTAFTDELLARVRALPGVTGVTMGEAPPYYGVTSFPDLEVEGREGTGADLLRVAIDPVPPGFFDLLGIQVSAGRDFTGDEDAAHAPVVVLSQGFADAISPGRSLLGERVRLAPGGRWQTVVGIVNDVAAEGVRGPYRHLQVYVPYSRDYHPLDRGLRPPAPLIIRTGGDPQSLTPLIRGVVRSIDPDLPPPDIATVESHFASQLAAPRFNSLLLTIFAALALLLAAVGLFGVLSYAVARRTREIGIRMALGARAGQVRTLVVQQGMLPALVGLGVGVLMALFATRALAALLYGVEARDATTFALAGLVLVLVALVAAWIPARRATRVDPMVALRAE